MDLKQSHNIAEFHKKDGLRYILDALPSIIEEGVENEGLEYQINIMFDHRDSIFVARIPELGGCHTHGDTPQEGLEKAPEAIALWIETASED